MHSKNCWHEWKSFLIYHSKQTALSSIRFHSIWYTESQFNQSLCRISTTPGLESVFGSRILWTSLTHLEETCVFTVSGIVTPSDICFFSINLRFLSSNGIFPQIIIKSITPRLHTSLVLGSYGAPRKSSGEA